MLFGDRTEEHRLPFGDDAVWDALVSVLSAPGSGFRNVVADPVVRRVTAETPRSAWSWGERVTVEVAWLAADRTALRLRSAPRVRLNISASRRHAGNLARVLDGVSVALRSRAAPAAPAAPVAPAATVFCAHCRTVNPGDAEQCSACGASLAPPAAEGPAEAPGVPPLEAAPRRRRRSGALVVAGVIVVIAGLAFAGVMVSRAGESGPAFDPAQATSLAQASLIDAADLPGTGWTVLPVDEGAADDALGGSPECAALFAEGEAFPAQFDATLAGRAERAFERAAAEGAAIPASIEVDVRILADAGPLAGVEDRYRALLDRSELLRCFETAFAQPGVTIEAARVPASSAVPPAGVAAAFELALTVQEQRLVLRFELYLWAVGNALVAIDVSGERGAVLSEAARAAVARTHERLLQASARADGG